MPVPLLAWLILIPSRALSRSPPLIPPPFIPPRRRFPLLLCHLHSSLRCSAPLPRCSPSRSTAATVPFQIEQTAARRWRNRADGGEETAESSRQRREGRIKRNRRGDGRIEGSTYVIDRLLTDSNVLQHWLTQVPSVASRPPSRPACSALPIRRRQSDTLKTLLSAANNCCCSLLICPCQISKRRGSPVPRADG